LQLGFQNEHMNLESRERLATLIKQARTGMNKSAFADLLGVSHTAVGSWENGVYMPDVKSLLRIADILGLSVEDLVCVVEGKPAKTSRGLELSEILNQIKHMPFKELVKIERAVSDRLVAIAEAS